MSEPILVVLIHNAALLLGIAIIFDLAITQRRAHRITWWQVPFGFLIGAVGIVLMLTPWIYAPGIVFDSRSILLGISGLFFGAVPTLFAMLITAAFRISIGGPATLTGVCVILASGTLGIAWRYFRKPHLSNLSWRELYLFGIAVHIIMLALFFLLPWETTFQVLRAMALPVILLYPIATTALGAMLTNRLKHDQAIQDLSDSEERLRLATGAANIGFFDRDLTTGAVHFSPEWKHQLGYEPHELANDPLEWSSRLHPEDRERILEIEKAYLSGARKDYEIQYRLRHKDGSYRWILDRGEHQTDEHGKSIRLLGCHIDITEQVHAQEAVSASERRFRSLAESSQDSITLYDRNCRLLYENPTGLLISGLSQEDALGKTPRETSPSGEIGETLQADIQSVFESGHSTHRMLDWQTEGSKIILDLHLSPVYGEDNQVEQVLGISRDITTLKAAQQALQKSEELYRVLTESIQDVVWILRRPDLVLPLCQPIGRKHARLYRPGNYGRAGSIRSH